MGEHNEGMEAVSTLAQIVKENVLRVLDEQQVSLRELGRRTGIANSSLSVMLRGEQEVQTDTTQRIADALGVKVAELVLEHEHAAH